MKRLLRLFVDDALAESVLGDLSEERHRRASRSPLRASLWYWRELLVLTAHAGLGRAQRGGASLARGRWTSSGLAAEVRQALRAVRRTPATSLVVILTLAAGLGVNTAIFSVVYGVLLQPLPFPDPGRVVIVEGVRRTQPASLYSTSLEDFRDFVRSARSFQSLGLAGYWTFNLTSVDTPLRIVGARVSGQFFETLGTAPALGRWLGEGDERSATNLPEPAVISYGLWQRQLGGRPDAIGQMLLLNGVKTTVVGVMPVSFRFLAGDVEIWAPLGDALDGAPRNARFLTAVGRLRRGVSVPQARDDLRVISGALAERFPDTNRDWSVAVVPALDALTSDVRDQLVLLLAAVTVVLAVAAINVTGLLGARRTARHREFAIRAALGAGALRLARVSIFEGLWLGVAGLALGLLAATPCLALLRAAAPASLPRVTDVALTEPVVGASVIAMVSIACVAGIGPLVGRARRRPARALAGSRSSAPAAGRSLGRAGLVVAQVALAFTLLAGAGLLVRSLMSVLAVAPGFQPDRLLTMRVFLGPPRYTTIEAQRQYADRALDTLRHVPGITMATAASQAPFDLQGSGASVPTTIEGRPYEAGARPSVLYRVVAPDYFSSMGLRILEGRALAIDDRTASPAVVVINQAMSQRYWPGHSPIGARLRWPDLSESPALTVVGVVNDVATDGLEKQEAPAIYGPYAQRTLAYLRWLTFLVRSETDPTARASAVRAALQAVDHDQPIYAVETMDTIMSRSLAERRFALVLMLAFAGLTLLLATLGLYGALAQTVLERSREIGVRLALGASRSQVFRAVVGQGVVLLAVGLGVGAVITAATGRFVSAVLFGVTPWDAATHLVMAGLLLAIGVVACSLPALRASRTDPVHALRVD